MPFDSTKLPVWNNAGTEPPQTLKDSGWTVQAKPPADYFNWQWNLTYLMLKNIVENAQSIDQKGHPNGYAGLDSNGKVINSDGSYPNTVQSVNNKTGAVTLIASDVGAETPDGALQKINTAIANLIGGAPGALDTLKELADALGEDANFSATIINRLTTDEQTVATHKADYKAHVPYAVATGSANVYAVTLNPAPTAYTDGMAVSVKINADATGASTLNVNSLGAKPIKKANGNDVTNLKVNGVYTLRYNASTGNFILQGEGGEYGSATANDVRSTKTFGTENGVQQGALDLSNLVSANIKAGITIDGVSGKSSVVDTADAATAFNDSGIYNMTSNFIQISLAVQPIHISVTQGTHSITYDASVGTDRYVIDGVTKYFASEGGYVNSTGFKFWTNGWATGNTNWTAQIPSTPTTADKILVGSSAYANGIKLIGTANVSKKWASGVYPSNGSFTISSLSFKPNVIIIKAKTRTVNLCGLTYVNASVLGSSNDLKISTDVNGNAWGANWQLTINSDGFFSTTPTGSEDYAWYASE